MPPTTKKRGPPSYLLTPSLRRIRTFRLPPFYGNSVLNSVEVTELMDVSSTWTALLEKAVEGIDENAVENVQYETDVGSRLTAKVRSPMGSVRSFSKSVAQDPTRPMSMPLSLAKLPLCEVVSGSFSSVIVTSSVGLEPCKEKKAIMKRVILGITFYVHVRTTCLHFQEKYYNYRTHWETVWYDAWGDLDENHREEE